MILDPSEVSDIRSTYSDKITRAVSQFGGCLFWAGVTVHYLKSKGIRAILVGGSASFPVTDDISTISSPIPTHGSFMWSPGDGRSEKILKNGEVNMLEVHAWVCAAIEGKPLFIDLSIKYMPEFFREMFEGYGVPWTWEPPEYLYSYESEVNGSDSKMPVYIAHTDACAYLNQSYLSVVCEMGFPSIY